MLRSQLQCTGIWICPRRCRGENLQTVYHETYYSDNELEGKVQLRYTKRVCTVCGYVERRPVPFSKETV
jgi:hypothetical protein